MAQKREHDQKKGVRDLGFDLRERVKELECLYGISRILDRLNAPRDSAYVQVLKLVQAAFQHPQETCVQITMQGKTYRTENYRGGVPHLTAAIKMGKEPLGSLEVGFLGDASGVPAFLKEERRLLGAVAEHLGTTAARLRMAVQLENSEKFYRSLFQNASEGIFLHYIDGRIGMANKAMSRISGYSLTELRKMNVKDIVSYDETETGSYRTKARPSAVLTRPATLLTKGGSTKYVEVSESRLGKAEKAFVTQTIVRDVSLERRRTESAHAYAGHVIIAQENERRRIARELHDDTIQAIVSLGMDIDGVLKIEKGLPASAAARLEALRDRTRKIGDSVKSLTRALRPPMLDEVGLLTALRWLSAESVKGRAIETHFEIRGDARRLSPEAEVTIFRIAQEALNNVVKHSGASEATVALSFDDNSVSLTVKDNGHGFHPPSGESRSKSGKMGLTGMEERARLLGGKLTITSGESGTTVILEAPV